MALPVERYEALVQWVREAGGSLHPSVEIYLDQVTKASFRVREGGSLKAGDEVVKLPLGRSISYLNAISGHDQFESAGLHSFMHPENSPYFPMEFLDNVPPHVIGRFFLIQQYLLGPNSLWWPYIRTLPQPEHMGGTLPAVWPQDDIEFLQGTNAYVAVQEIKSTLKKEYKQAVRLLPPNLAPEYTRALYLWAYCVFTSRSFRPSLVVPPPELLGLECQPDDFSLLLPLFDVGNHSPLATISWTANEESQSCSFRTEQSSAAGTQVFNNYGMKTNAELLLGYGFLLPEGPDFHNDYVHIKLKTSHDYQGLAASRIVSLRPMNQPSSLVGRSRCSPLVVGPIARQFSHLQDSLVEDLYDIISEAQSHEKGAKPTLPVLMAGKIPIDMMENLIDAIGSKLSYDLDTLDSFELPRDDLNGNQQLAVRYHDQCRKVLVNTIQSLGVST